MRVFVTGGTGELGRPAVRALREAGHVVQVSSRSGENDAIILGLGAIPVRVDLGNRHGLHAAVADAEAVVHLATHIPPTDAMGLAARWRDNDRLRRDTTRDLVDGALASRIEVMVLQSYFAVLAPGDGDWMPDGEGRRPARGWSHFGAMESLIDAEHELARLDDVGIRAVSLRFGSLYSESSEQLHAQVRGLLTDEAVIPGDGTNHWPFAHNADAGAAVACALRAPAGGYQVCDDRPVTVDEFWEMAATAVHVTVPARQWLDPGHPMAPILTGSWRLSNASFCDATGWRPRVSCVTDGWPPAAERFAAENTARRRVVT